MKLFLKGERCYSDKCAVTKRPYPPGQHGQARQKLSEYAVRLREKQKVRRVYGLVERQFQRYYVEATRRQGRTGEEMLGLLEQRLDNVVYRMGFATTRAEARQVVKHAHVLINGKRVDIPSYAVRKGDKIELREESRQLALVQKALQFADSRPTPSWLEVDKASLSGTFKGGFTRDELNEPSIREQLVVEYYSR
jgi:small subunit ribosomal protein S4